MSKPPLCRWCGKPIPKKTEIIWFGFGGRAAVADVSKATPFTKEEVAKLTNKQVLQVRWRQWQDGRRPYIEKASLWDGKSYVDEFFCSQSHAVAFAYAAARGGFFSLAYGDAQQKMEKEHGKET